MTIKLYYFPNACSLAPHVTLRELDIPFELVRVDLAQKRTERGEDFLVINERGQVPVLELPSGDRFTEVSVILEFIAAQRPDCELLPKETNARLRTKEWLSFLTAELHKAGFAPLFRTNTPPDYINVARQNVERHFDFMEKRASGRSFLTGGTFTIADALALPMLRWAARKEIDLTRWPSLLRVRENIEARQSVQDAKRAEGIT
jgi:glutathione S-transferase